MATRIKWVKYCTENYRDSNSDVDRIVFFEDMLYREQDPPSTSPLPRRLFLIHTIDGILDQALIYLERLR